MPRGRRSSVTLKGRGHKIFLDLKLCDIPNTVQKAMRVLSGLEVDMTQPACKRHDRR